MTLISDDYSPASDPTGEGSGIGNDFAGASHQFGSDADLDQYDIEFGETENGYAGVLVPKNPGVNR